MAIQTASNFMYKGKNFLDARQSFDTILAMTSFSIASLPEGFIAYNKETDKYYKFNSTNTVDMTLGKWREYNGGGGSSTDEKVKLDATATDAKYLNELIDNTTIEVDATNNCLVVKKIDGQTATVAEINFLTGVTSNIQTQIDNLGKSMTMYGVFGTKADLLASTTPTPVDGNTAIVIADEDNNNKQMTYIYIASNSAWTQVAESSVTVRDFTTEPINLATETTGTLHKSKIDTAIARLADVLDKTTYRGTGDGIVKQADKLTGLTATIAALNQAVTDSHTHSNKAVLDKIVSNGIGSGFLADNGKYISILHIGTTSPTYDSQIWIDNTDSSKPILKIFDGTNWVTISSASSGGCSGEVKISKAEGNILEKKEDGLFVKATSSSGGVQEVEITGVENNLRLISSVSTNKNNETELTYHAKNDCVICVSIITGNGNHEGNCYDREISVITEGRKVSEYDEHEDKTYSGTAHLEFYVLKSGQSITSKGKMTNGNDSCELVNSLYLFTSILDISNTEYMFWGHNENKSALTREFTPTKSGYALVFRMAMGGSYNSEGLQFSGTGGEVITSTYIQPTIISGYATYITYELYKVNTGNTLKVSQYSNNASGARHVLIGAFIEDEDITRFSLEGLGLKINGKSAYEIAVDNGFVGTETEWLESLKGSDGKDGKSISTITKDDDNNIIVTFTDGSTQNIGKLSVDIQGDFLTSDGFGNLRYYNGHFQYYDNTTSTWIDTSVTPSNVYIMNMIPQEMKKIFAVYDTVLGKYKLKFEEPDDTIIDGQVACVVEKVIIRRKLGSAPISETDGDLVLEIKRKDFGTCKNEYFVDNTLSPSIGDIYYYKAFPMSTTGFYNYSELNETDGIKCKNYNLYGFKLDQNESDPSSMITYIEDNKYFESARMDYNSDTFKYGDWEDSWFIKNLKPCMLKYDGTVDYELDKDDYSKKLDGTDSDVSNDSYGGNAMVGIPKVYWKIVDNGDNTANIYFSDKKVDDDFHCWSHIDNNGNEIDYCYMPIYNGSNVNSVLRSISGKAPMASQTATTEITYAKSNNTGSDIIWYTELFNDRMLINLLLLLIGKSTDTQNVFGTGNNNSYVSASNTGIKNTGTMNTKGLFWGNQDNKSGVKVFGIEHWYGNIWRRIGGWINDKGTQKIKMTYGQSDGSTTDGYNETGSGYISIGGATPSGANGGYISNMLITDDGLIPTIASGSVTTYYCDGLWFNNSQVDYASVGGGSSSNSPAGALSSNLSIASSYAVITAGAAISCKPLAKAS